MASQPLQISRSDAAPVNRTKAPADRDLFVMHPESGTLIGAIPRSNDALLANDNLQELEAVSQGCKAMLRTYWMHIPQNVRQGLLNQTKVVLNPSEWEDEIFCVSLDSYQTMLRTLVQLKPATRPNLAISENGNFLAAWKNESTKVVLEFLAADRMRWLISSNEGDPSRASGEANVETFRQISVVHGGRGVIDGAP